MLIQRGDTSLVNTQPFPDRIATLYGAVENGYPCIITGFQLIIDTDENVGIARIGQFQDFSPSASARIACANNRSYQGRHSSNNACR